MEEQWHLLEPRFHSTSAVVLEEHAEEMEKMQQCIASGRSTQLIKSSGTACSVTRHITLHLNEVVSHGEAASC